MTDSKTRPQKKSARRVSRELALQGVYEWLAKACQEEAVVIDAHIQDNPEFAKADAQHYKTILYGAINEAQELRSIFAPFLDRQPEELSPVEHAVLLIAAYEFKHHLDIPYKVIINEGVELAKSFGGTDGFKFVNGVLDKLAAELRALEVNALRRS